MAWVIPRILKSVNPWIRVPRVQAAGIFHAGLDPLSGSRDPHEQFSINFISRVYYLQYKNLLLVRLRGASSGHCAESAHSRDIPMRNRRIQGHWGSESTRTLARPGGSGSSWSCAFWSCQGGANSHATGWAVLQKRRETRVSACRSARMCGKRGGVAKVRVKDMTRQTRTKRYNVAVRYVTGNVIEAMRDKGLMRHV